MGSVGRIDATSEGGFDRMDVHFSALPLTAKVSIATSVCQAVIGCAISRLCDIQYLFLFMFMFIDYFYSLTGIYSRLRTPAELAEETYVRNARKRPEFTAFMRYANPARRGTCQGAPFDRRNTR